MSSYAPKVEPPNTPDAGSPSSSSAAPATKSQNLQPVATKQMRQQVVLWMKEEFKKHGKPHLMIKNVREFPSHFRASDKTNLQKQSERWVKRNEIVTREARNPRTVHASQAGIRHRVNTKAAPGR